jgi:peptidoglycan L-alanyl-D-glutamate endopeptidase CwlK
MAFVLGGSSKYQLERAHPDLCKVIERAIQLTRCDFKVQEVARSAARQKQLVASGASWTMNSRHLPKVPAARPELGPVSHAADLVPLFDFDGDGRAELRWDWALCYQVAAAMRQAAIELGVRITWGGAWDICLNDLGEDMEDEVAAYVSRRKAAGKRAAIDGPHFELEREVYP